jgi:protein tyrosine phosphatase
VYFEYEKTIIHKSILLRSFTLIDTKSGYKEEITHIQVICWPDYLAPEENQAFPMIEYLMSILKTGTISAPIVVHCR